MRQDAEIHEAINRFSRLMWNRDISILDEFADDADILLAASEPGVVGRGRREIGDLLRGVFALSDRLRWDWSERIVSWSGAIAWFYAEGDLVMGDDGREERMRYRASGVLQQEGEVWRWRLFHGAEPKV